MSRIVVEPSGIIRTIYDDDLRELLHAGQATIQRVSHVEPTADGRWTADLSPINGPMLGPFERRADALDAEICWINNNVL